jgi:hypothetical protein
MYLRDGVGAETESPGPLVRRVRARSTCAVWIQGCYEQCRHVLEIAVPADEMRDDCMYYYCSLARQPVRDGRW